MSKRHSGEESAGITQEKKAWPSSHLTGIKIMTKINTIIVNFPNHAEMEVAILEMHKHGFDLEMIPIIGKTARPLNLCISF